MATGRIDGHSGYLDTARRVIALNPEATPAEIEAQLRDQLRVLARTGDEPRPESAPMGRPTLALVHSAEESPRRSHRDGTEAAELDRDPRVVG